MASETPVEAGAPNLNLTPEEKRVYGQLFRQADTDGVGVVTGEVAVKFFEKTRLDSRVLGEVSQYTGLFERQALQNGNMLPGEAAKQIFEKSGLPNDVLGRIWMLADTEQRGALVQTEFVIAMHLLTSVKTGALRALPNILPAALYEAATRRGSNAGAGIPRQGSPTTAGTTPPISAVPRQLTGQGQIPQMRTGSPLGRPPLSSQTTGDWLVTPADKGRFDQLYDELDKTKKGFITGEEAVPFFSQSNLSEDALAQIWDLADVHSEGRLTRDEFAVAMYLIRQQRTKRDGSALPTTLPANLIPPSLRTPQQQQQSQQQQQQARPRTANSASAFDPPPAARPPPPQQKPSAMDDLFGLDDIHPPAPAQVPVRTGGSAPGDPFASSLSLSPKAPSSPARPSPSASTFRPFVPSSSFGRGLTTQATGGSNTSASAKPAAIEDDLLGDAEPEVSKKLTSETTELANLSNQIGSLTKQVQDVQGQRTGIQNELTQSSAQKKNFEQRLTQLRAMYEKEAQDVRALETQLTTSKNETKKLQGEFAMVDASYQELQNQHRQLLGALQADQQENAALKEKIRAANAEVAQLKPQIEKLKSDARQQKGLVAINRKQLATNEGERDKLKGEVEDLTRSNEELARQASQVSISATNSPPPPPPAQVASPALSTASANNPFFRRTGSTDITSTFSPPIRSFTDRAFDDVFGPGPAGAGGNASAAAAAIFKQNTGASTGSAASFATPASTSPNASRQPTVAGDQQQQQQPTTLAEAGRSNSGFPHFVDAAESLSTSRQVSPALSRTETANQETLAASPLEPAQTGHSLAASGSGSRPASPASATEGRPAFGSISEETGKPSAAAVPASAAAAAAASSGGKEADPFAVDQDKAKEDFESAFASFKQARAGPTAATSSNDTAKAFSTFSSEFPPISELERDESDSESERGGFDDDFAPASPPPKHVVEKSIGSRSASPVVPKTLPDAAAASPEPAVSDKPATSPSHLNNLSSSNINDIFGSSSAAAAPTAAPATAKSPAPFDDLDDDFEGLEDAKEGSADDDFATISRSGLDDFNPVFDSSPPPSQAKSDATHPGAGLGGGTNTTSFGTESSFDFGSLSGTSAAGSTAGASATPAAASASTAAAAGPSGTGAPAVNQTKAATGPAESASSPSTSHDWDALFAGLDSATTPTASSQTLATSLDNDQATGAAIGTATTTGAATTTSATTAADGGETAGGESRPNAPGRALTEEGEHDDPILKNLTGMGYSRKEALAALEKYDYNLERVVILSPVGSG
ncbi:uncharacterized protein C8A04DRAFT_38654 [Dichotomopilus funicola]|uniref:Uncharacterized protein n=1 Tax=Dichotomopilus funicola TaxID=1934379 RepID=A0AAN6UZL8_9PEZI|nr:hypothetical protein C8A04DRAFT_38654 [Dichotomopilus funicola]